MDKQIKFTLEAKNSLHSLNIDAQKAIKKDLKKLAKSEIRSKQLKEQLTGFNSITVGNYRAILAIEKDRIIVFDCDHRKNIYDKYKK